jgi:hypothetical protein
MPLATYWSDHRNNTRRRAKITKHCIPALTYTDLCADYTAQKQRYFMPYLPRIYTALHFATCIGVIKTPLSIQTAWWSTCDIWLLHFFRFFNLFGRDSKIIIIIIPLNDTCTSTVFIKSLQPSENYMYRVLLQSMCTLHLWVLYDFNCKPALFPWTALTHRFL